MSDDKQRQTLCGKTPYNAVYGVIKTTSFVFTLFSRDPRKTTVSTILRHNGTSSCQQNRSEIKRDSVFQLSVVIEDNPGKLSTWPITEYMGSPRNQSKLQANALC